MKRVARVMPKGDGKGKLKTRKVKGLLDGEEHTFKIRPYVAPIEIAKWDVKKKEKKK